MPHEPGSFDVHPPAADEADRRTVRRVAAFGAAAVAATALATAGVASGAGAGSGSAGSAGPGNYGPGRVAVATASASPTASASASASASSAPQLRIQIAYDRVGRDLTLTFTFAGHVLEPLTSAGGKLTFPTPAQRNIGMGETLLWGDGTNANVPVTGRRCPVDQEPRTLHEVADTYSVKKTYTGPGTYTIHYSYAACGLTGGKISGTIPITIPK